jgi:hypothetical protein
MECADKKGAEILKNGEKTARGKRLIFILL